MKLELSWNDVEKAVKSWSNAIEKHEEQDCNYIILAINRGGTIPAIMLSHQLESKPSVLNFITSNIDNGTLNETNETWINQRTLDIIDKHFSSGVRNPRLLIVEDIIDSGDTLDNIMEELDVYFTDDEFLDKNLKILSLVNRVDRYKTNCLSYLSLKEDTFIAMNIEWIHFPWERK